MKVYVNPKSLLSERGSVVTIGSFDGVHCGHKVILKELIRVAQQKGLESALITLFPHPRKVLNLDLKGFGLLNSLEEKESILAECGLDILVELEFTKLFSEMSAREFAVKYLSKVLNAKVVVIGYDHQFGRDRTGGYEVLVKCGNELGFEVVEIPKHDVNSHKVSSTVIRKALKNGDMERVSQSLGYRYFIVGTLEENGALCVKDDMKLFPKDGVYSVNIQSGQTTEPCDLSVCGRELKILTLLKGSYSGVVKIIL